MVPESAWESVDRFFDNIDFIPRFAFDFFPVAFAQAGLPGGARRGSGSQPLSSFEKRLKGISLRSPLHAIHGPRTEPKATENSSSPLDEDAIDQARRGYRGLGGLIKSRLWGPGGW